MRDFLYFYKMPQINIFTYLSQTTWTILLFIIYYINMKQVLLPSLLETIKLKNNYITTKNKDIKFNKEISKYSNKYLNL